LPNGRNGSAFHRQWLWPLTLKGSENGVVAVENDFGPISTGHHRWST
jgi:hypothetical protein